MQTLNNILSPLKSVIPLGMAVFIALCLNFSPLLFNFIWGNHDWLPLLYNNALHHGLIEGRFSQYILLTFLLGGKLLPLLNILLGFILYALALVLLCRYFFGFKNTVFSTAIALIAAATLSYICEVLYFQFITFSLLSWPLFAVFSLLLAQKATQSHPIFFTCLSTLFLFITIGGYPPAVNFFIVATICRLMLEQNISLKNLFIKSFPYTIALIFAAIMLKTAFVYMQKEHLMISLYNGETTPIQELLFKIPHTLKNSLFSFMRPQPFLEIEFKTISSFLALIFAILFLLTTSSAKQKIIRLLLLISLIIGLKFTAFIANPPTDSIFSQNDPIYFMVRADFFAMPIFILFCLLYLNQNQPCFLKNITYALAFALIWLNLNQNLAFCKTHLLGFRAENALLERLVERINNHPNFSNQSYYTLVQAGELPLRRRFYHTDLKTGYYTLNVPYSRHWIAFEYYNFFQPETFVREGTSINPLDITPQMIHFLTTRINSWPHPDSVYVDDKHAIIALTPQGRQMLTQQFNLLTGRNP